MNKVKLAIALFFYTLPFLFPISKSLAETDDQIEQFMSMSLDQLLNVKVKVGSNVSESQLQQPVTISTINRAEIKLSGARTVNELLSLYTPGYFLVEDQDDTIAGFRGLAPDNNSKVMLLLNGVNINTEWFWGPADAILNGLDMEYIERIEVVRGPGSVTQGQGALLGVINIITHHQNSSNIKIAHGADGLNKQSLSYLTEFESGLFSVYATTGKYQGETMENSGWSQLHSEQGLSIYERQHQLHRSEYDNLLLSAKIDHWKANLYRFKQKRDLYNFFRDREQVEQSLTGFDIEKIIPIKPEIGLTISAKYLIDDYSLYSHGNNLPVESREVFERFESGFVPLYESFIGADSLVESGLTMGGTREVRKGLKGILNLDNIENHLIAFGFEFNHFSMGRKNSDGNNFIINEEVQRIGLSSNGVGGFEQSGTVNSNNAWVKPDSISIKSLFLEDLFKLSEKSDLFAAFRWDDHPNWGKHFSPRVGIHYNPNENHFVRVSWQTGFRGAVGVQYAGGFVQDGFLAENNFEAVNQVATTLADFDFDGNPNNDTRTLSPVEPETIATFEIAHHYIKDNLQIRTVLFHNTVEDILAAQAHGYVGLSFGDSIGTDQLGTWNGNWYYQNQKGQLKQAGIEIELDFDINNWRFSTSHSNVSILSADDGVIGPYVLQGEKVAAYPDDVTRFRVNHKIDLGMIELTSRLTGVYYWSYDEPRGSHVKGGEIINLGITIQPTKLESLSVDIVAKNITNTNNFYPINGTGDAVGGEGTPSTEAFSWWLAIRYQF